MVAERTHTIWPQAVREPIAVALRVHLLLPQLPANISLAGGV